MAQRKGVETTVVPEVVPGAIDIPGKATRGLANAGAGTPIIPPAVPLPPNVTKEWMLTAYGQTRNDGGLGITVNPLSSDNAALGQLGYSFPGAATDDNQWCVSFIMPPNYDSTRPVVAELAVVGE